MMKNITGDQKNTIIWFFFFSLSLIFACQGIISVHSYAHNNLQGSLLFCLVYFVTQHWDGWLKITNHKSWSEPAIQTEDKHSGKNFGLKDLTMSYLFNFPTVFSWEVGPFRRDKCCHLLPSYHIAWLQPTRAAKLHGWWSLLWAPLHEAFWWLWCLHQAQRLGVSRSLARFRLLVTVILKSQKKAVDS